MSTPLTVERFFEEGGLLSQVKKNYRQRPGQAECAESILTAIQTHQHLVGEAPTGFGKSFAYLVPAIIEAVAEGKRVILSTESLNLQDQYLNKDIPLLVQALNLAGYRLTYAAAKGRNNYICRDKLDEDEFHNSSNVMEWARAQSIDNSTGDIASIPFEFNSSDWRGVGADEDCLKKACPYYLKGPRGESDCFVCCAQRGFREAQLIVTNHTMLLLDAKTGCGSILGEYDVVIVDEAQSFAGKARDCWGMEFKPRTISYSARIMRRMLNRAHVSYIEECDLEGLRTLEDEMFAPFADLVAKGDSITLKQIDPAIIERSKVAADALVIRLKSMNQDLNDFITQPEDHPETVVLRQVKDKLSKLTSELSHIYGERIEEEYADNWLTFLDTATSPRGVKHGVLNLKPIEVAPLMQGLLLNVVSTCVFFSATMRVMNSFSYMKRDLGLPFSTTLEFVGESPFDLEEQVTVYFPRGLEAPPPYGKLGDYLYDLEESLVELINFIGGKTLVLFTNSKHMQAVHARVSARVQYRCYLQGTASPDMLLEAFKADETSCLFGSRRFFVGVDVPGSSLSCVALARAPFPVPTDPLFAARSAKLEERGQSPFDLLSMPQMLFDLRQAFGRLTRDENDIGTFAFLDSRALGKGYAQHIRAALPKRKVTSRLGEVTGCMAEEPVSRQAPTRVRHYQRMLDAVED